MTYRYVGLAVMRLQPLHKGHTLLIKQMCDDCEKVVIVIGSADKKVTYHNPYDIETRKTMIKNVFGNRVKIVPADDLGITGYKREWSDYIHDKLSKIGMPEPTDYYTGSPVDSKYYEHSFWNGNDEKEITSEHYTSDNILKRIHIVDRMSNDIPPATDLRKSILLGDDMWKNYIPRVNWDTVKYNFPAAYRFL